jgi:hypothetical protein
VVAASIKKKTIQQQYKAVTKLGQINVRATALDPKEVEMRS